MDELLLPASLGYEGRIQVTIYTTKTARVIVEAHRVNKRGYDERASRVSKMMGKLSCTGLIPGVKYNCLHLKAY